MGLRYIGQDLTTCWRPGGHAGLHQAHPSWANASGVLPTWNDVACADQVAFLDLFGYGDKGMDARSDLQELLESLKDLQ